MLADLVEHVWGLLRHPGDEWAEIKARHYRLGTLLTHVMLLAAIPVICAFIGSTQFGWRVGDSPVVRLTAQSGLLIAVLYYAVILVATFSIGWMIHWMGGTYGAQQPLSQCLALAAYIPVPLFLIGLFQIIPVAWINLVVALPALAYTVFLLYTGIPVVMEIPAERGFLFGSAVLAVGLVGLVGMLVVTVLLWGIGIGPVYALL